jgi:hypothetical protein
MAASATYTEIATASPSNATVNFTSIPQTYTDLVVAIYGRDQSTASSAVSMYWAYNGTYGSGTNNSYTEFLATGTTISQGNTSNQNLIGCGGFPGTSPAANVFGAGLLHIPNYSNTTTFKSWIFRTSGEPNNANGRTTLNFGLYRSTAAITSIYIQLQGNFAAGSQVTLYGIAAA